jgi:glycosyltransferase involved in cell wall biosynthesis
VKRFSYVCADPGIPIPGRKGASIHVESVCRAFTRAGLDGEIVTVRPEARTLGGLPVRRLHLPLGQCSMEKREAGLFLAGLTSTAGPGGGCDFIYERYSLWHAGGLARARRLGVPFILEVNSPLPEEERRFRKLENQELAEGIARLLLSEADGIVCVSEEVAEWVVERRRHENGVWIVPNGVDAKLFSPNSASRPERLPPPDVPLVAFCGSFRPWHATDDLLEAFRLLLENGVEDAHLLCVGDGPLRERFEERARNLGLDGRVHVTGLLPHDEVPAWLRGADVAVAPYPAMNGFYFSPLKIFEFMALGLPVVAADAGQVSRLVGNGERGLLYPPGDPRGLAEAVAQLLADRPRAKCLGDAGRAWVLANATWSKRTRHMLNRIDELCSA